MLYAHPGILTGARIYAPALLIIALLFLCACSAQTKQLNRELILPNDFKVADSTDTFLKAHLKNGDVVVFDDWFSDDERRVVEGSGVRLNPNRDTLSEGTVVMPIDSVALFETNQLERSGPVRGMTVLTGITAAVTIYCATSPKTCFGSCPTFYLPRGDSLHLQAEGFSASIAPSLEDTDVDAITPDLKNDELTITMKNEALETHVVRHVHLLTVPKASEEGFVFRDSMDHFFQTGPMHPPASCFAPEGNCLPQLQYKDNNERYSLADSLDLATKEWIDLSFANAPKADLGLVLNVRQSLMSTFLLYQTLAYMGEDVGYWLAQLERNQLSINDPMRFFLRQVAELDVFIEDAAGSWTKVGTLSEYGPLASDTHFIHIPDTNADTLNIRLRQTKGFWRIDNAALVKKEGQVFPQRLYPERIAQKGTWNQTALDELLDPETSLVTMPGDQYDIYFSLPENAAYYSYFLESRGYYLEWIRQEWLSDEDPNQVRQIFINPEQAMKELAPSFKAIEPYMEHAFWSSRYATQ